MTLEDFVAFNLALLAAMASPGPALLYALRTAIAEGRAAGIAAGFGLAVIASGWTLAALLGLAGLFELFPGAYAAARIAGAGYLLWIAWCTWRDANRPVEAVARRPGRAFRGGMLVNLANPKSVLFAAAVIAVMLPAEISPAEKAAIWLNHLCLEAAVYAGIAAALGSDALARRFMSFKPALDRISAAVLAALAVRIALDR